MHRCCGIHRRVLDSLAFLSAACTWAPAPRTPSESPTRGRGIFRPDPAANRRYGILGAFPARRPSALQSICRYGGRPHRTRTRPSQFSDRGCQGRAGGSTGTGTITAESNLEIKGKGISAAGAGPALSRSATVGAKAGSGHIHSGAVATEPWKSRQGHRGHSEGCDPSNFRVSRASHGSPPATSSRSKPARRPFVTCMTATALVQSPVTVPEPPGTARRGRRWGDRLHRRQHLNLTTPYTLGFKLAFCDGGLPSLPTKRPTTRHGGGLILRAGRTTRSRCGGWRLLLVATGV